MLDDDILDRMRRVRSSESIQPHIPTSFPVGVAFRATWLALHDPMQMRRTQSMTTFHGAPAHTPQHLLLLPALCLDIRGPQVLWCSGPTCTYRNSSSSAGPKQNQVLSASLAVDLSEGALGRLSALATCPHGRLVKRKEPSAQFHTDSNVNSPQPIYGLFVRGRSYLYWKTATLVIAAFGGRSQHIREGRADTVTIRQLEHFQANPEAQSAPLIYI